MTECAGVRTTGIQAGRYRWTRNLVTANRLEQTIGGIWHVAVHAPTATRVRGMMGVRGHILRIFGVTLETGVVTSHAGLQLIISPLFQRLVVRWMHGMARQAGHLAMLVTGRLYQSVVLAPGNSSHPIGPKTLLRYPLL